MGEKTMQREVSKTFLIMIVTGIFWQTNVYAETFANIKGDFSTNIMDIAYPSDGHDSLRPTADSSVVMNVTLDWNLVSLNDFDETNGYLDVSGFVTIEWVSDSYTTSLDAVELIRPNLVWKPPVVLLNSVETYEIIGHDTSVKVRYNFTSKECQWKPWVVARAACSPDVKYYPFDKQSCAFRLSVWGYKNDEINLTSRTNTWGFLYFEENGEWVINKTSVETSVVNEFSVIDFKMQLTRRPLYYVINLIAPVILLGALSACTFLLPAESGERIGFSVTCFLSYVVLLNIIMGFLPSSGLPLSYLSYYTFVMMIFSAAMSLMAIVTLRIYHKSEQDPVPEFLTYTYRCFTCRYCEISSTMKISRTVKDSMKAKEKVVPLRTASASWDNNSLNTETLSQSYDNQSQSYDTQSQSYNNQSQSYDNLSQSYDNRSQGYDNLSQGSVKTEAENITWKNIAAFIDILLFLGFLGGQIFYSVAYLVPIFIN